MSLGLKTKEFFQTLKQDNVTSDIPIASIPISQLREDSLATFAKISGEFPLGITSKSFVRTEICLDKACIVTLFTYTPTDYDMKHDPTVLFFHGSGFVINLIPMHFPTLALFAKQAKCKVIIVDHPLAPEYTAYQITKISYDAVDYIIKNHRDFSVNLENMQLVGYSAGGNLVTGIVYNSIIRHTPLPIKCLILISPWIDLSFSIHNNNAFLVEQNTDEMLTTIALEYLASLYVGDGNVMDPLISPIYIENSWLKSFPSTYILCGQYDRLRGESHVFKEKLSLANVGVKEKVFQGQTHNFFIARQLLEEEDPALYLADIVTK